MKKLLLLTIFFAFVFAGMSVISGLRAAEEGCTDAQKSGESELECAKTCTTTTKAAEGAAGHTCSGDCANNLCSTKVDPKNDKYPSWILSSSNEHVFTKALIDFRLVYDRYPNNVAELIESGLLLTWPADPITGKPMKLVDELKPTETDLGKIAYVRKSDTEANFQIVSKMTDKYQIYEMPCCKTLDAYFGENAEKISDKKCYVKGAFEQSMKGLFTTAISRNDYLAGSDYPESCSEIAHKNFYLIKENLKPSFVSDDASKALYFEVGIATLNNKPVKFGKSTTCGQDCNGVESYEKFSWISPIEDSEESWVDDEDAYGKLANIQYFYSSKAIKNGGIDYPLSMIISESDILGK